MEYVDKVELSVTALVVGEVLREVEQDGEDGEFGAILGDEELGHMADGRVVDRLMGTGQGEEAADVVLHQTRRDALAVGEVEQLQCHVGIDRALVGIGNGGSPLHWSEIGEHVTLRRVDEEERLPVGSLLL